MAAKSKIDPVKAAIELGSKVIRVDGWENAVSGLGTSRDKTRSAVFVPKDLLTPIQCEWLFTQDDLANTIVCALVDDAMREGFGLEPEDGDQDPEEAQEAGAALAKRVNALKAWPILREGALWGRTYGRGGVLVVTKEANHAAPMPDAPGEIVALIPVDRLELSPHTYYQDPFHPDFGQPATYYLTPATSGGTSNAKQVIVHATRLILFPGADTPKRVRAYNNGCDLSVLQKVYEALRGANGNWDSVCAMMADMSQAVVKMQGLIDGISAGKSADIATRVALMDQMRSTVRAILLDAGDEENNPEEFGYAERGSLTGIGDVVDKTFVRLAAAAQMPVTRLMGISPAGLNATGDGDRKLWYDRVRAYQRDILAPAVLRLVKILDPGGAWVVTFPDLEKMSPIQEADLRNKVAMTDGVYIDKAVVTPAEVAVSRWGAGKYSAEMQIDMDLRDENGDIEHEDPEQDQPGGATGKASAGNQGRPGPGEKADQKKRKAPSARRRRAPSP